MNAPAFLRRWILHAALLPALALALHAASPGGPSLRQSLDGPNWRLATDPANSGRQDRWFDAPRSNSVPARVPWIVQDTFPGWHGAAWYWLEFAAPANPHPQGRWLLRFWAVDYQAEVWVNGQRAGGHEGGETPFTLDVTEALKPGATNRLAVRVLTPGNERVDGLVLAETPHRNKVVPYSAGSSFNHGGIIDSVELLCAPSLRIDDLFARADWKTGSLRVQTSVRNASSQPLRASIQFSAALSPAGQTLSAQSIEREFPPGDTTVECTLAVPSPRLWDVSEPNLYRATARVTAAGSDSFDETSVRCGFRDFRFDNGAFRLNGRRLFLRCSHTGNHTPIGMQLPFDPDWLRRDLINAKAMGFNSIRFIAGVAARYQLDLCDEIGLLVYEESYAAWCLADSPKMAERFDRSTEEMVRRDRNHPSLVIWGLLNETTDGPVFRHALAALPKVRALDDSRMVLLNSGRWDLPPGDASLAGLELWRHPGATDPNVTRNPLPRPLTAPWASWPPGSLALHPGPSDSSLLRWTAPEPGRHNVRARFTGLATRATTGVRVFHNSRPVFTGTINTGGASNSAFFEQTLDLARGDTIDCVVGDGGNGFGGDTTGLELLIRAPSGRAFDAAADFSLATNPSGPWSFGTIPAGAPNPQTAFRPYSESVTEGARKDRAGSLANPGSSRWEDVLHDIHPYQRMPHTAEVIQALRTLSGGSNPVFVSEYGVGSGVDLARVARHYEQLGKTNAEDARFYRDKLDRFLADFERWQMAAVFGRPEDFFDASLRKMAAQRLVGLNAIRANPNIVAHSVTGTVDQGMSGEGLFTTFRELKPGAVDALFDAWAPLRWCLFVEPAHFYRGQPARLEAVLANEDSLPPGQYPVLFQVFGPGPVKVWEKRVLVTIPGPTPEPPLAMPVLAEDVVINGPPGQYRFVAAFEHGAAAAGGETVFHLAEPLPITPARPEIVLWGEDPALAKWLGDHGFSARPFEPADASSRKVFLASARPPAPGGAAAFKNLATLLAQGSTAVFLAPEIFAKNGKGLGWAPLEKKGAIAESRGWLYHKDEWARPHPVFEGLPAGMLDCLYYREIIPDHVWTGLDAPLEAVAGANDVSFSYSSGLLLSIHPFGAGEFTLTTLRLRENLGRHPAADRILMNLLRHAARHQSQPPAPLPENFDARLRALGY